jgi:hypothetical protein
MASILTLDGVSDLGDEGARCKCVYNKRTKRRAKLCFIGKGARLPSGKKSRSGWAFMGTCR